MSLYGEISSATWWGDEVTPKQFKEDLDALGDIDTLNVYINSPGGDVFAGQAIHTMLKRHTAKKNVYIDGLAASTASVIAMAGDRIIMPKNATMMIHNAWTIAMGNKDKLRKMADDMEKIDAGIVTTYVGKTGKTDDEIIALMNAETWMTAEDAVKEGFADELEAEKKIAACVTPKFLSMYQHPPEALARAEPEQPEPEEAAEQGGFLLPVKQGEQQPVSDIEPQKRRFAATNRKFKITEVKHET